MKRFIRILFAVSLIFGFCRTVSALASDDYTIKYNGHKYILKYSAKNTESGGYMNEYFRPGENYGTWTELLALHHFPNVYSPIDQTVIFYDYLRSLNCESSLKIDEEKNSTIVDFIMVDKRKTPAVLEFNVFKYVKSPVCGSIGLQYAKRYAAYNDMEADKVKKEIEKARPKMLKRIEKFKVPEIEEVDINLEKSE